jgi:hypothetical protein
MIQFFKNKIQSNKEAMLLYVGNSFITLSSFLIIALLSHFLPIETYGIYRFIITISTLAITLGSLGFANALYYYLSSANFSQYQSKINSKFTKEFEPSLHILVTPQSFQMVIVMGYCCCCFKGSRNKS